MKRMLIVIVSMGVLIGILSGCGDDEIVVTPNSSERVSEGWKEYVAGNYEDAIAKYQDALEEDPNSADAYNGIGWSKARLGKNRDAIDSFKIAVAKEPSDVDARAGLAGAYLADGDYERAIASAKLVLSLKPNYTSYHDDIGVTDIHILLAECYYNVGKYDDAKAQIDLLGNSGKSLNMSSPSYLADLLSLIEDLGKKGS